MDKQIIDGIDVKKCVYNESGYCTISKEAYCYCCDKPNCHYKNWQRKEQECGQLKCLLEGVQKSLEVEIEECSKWSQLETEARYELLRKDQECEELKETFDGLFKVQYKLADNNKKLRQCLTEIKEIAEICKCHNTDGCYECKYFDDCEIEDEEIPTRDVCKLILQKISECEVK